MSIVLETLIRHFEREPNAVMWPNGIALRHGEIAAVLRHHALPVADRIRELEAQLTLPPIREKFVRVSDELVAELKAAPSKPVTVAIVEDGNELHMTFTEAQQAASEPVACSEKRHIQIHKSATLTPATESATAVFFSDDWYSVGKDGYVVRIHSVDPYSAESLNTLLNEVVDEHHPYRVLRVALVDESAHPSAAAVPVTEAMVRDAYRLASETWVEPECTETLYSLVANNLTAALQNAASEGAGA